MARRRSAVKDLTKLEEGGGVLEGRGRRGEDDSNLGSRSEWERWRHIPEECHTVECLACTLGCWCSWHCWGTQGYLETLEEPVGRF